MPSNAITIPTLIVNEANTHDIVKAYRIAIGDVSGNIQYHQSGLLKSKEPSLYAGLHYGKPWTRDAAINIWNGFGLIAPQVAKNTLIAQLTTNELNEVVITGQYWDKIIWTIGAWHYYLYAGDKAFLALAYKATQNTLKQLEKDEFSGEIGLFRGPAVYGDGVSAYPDIYTNHQIKSQKGTYSGIYHWAAVNDELKHPVGYGMPMHALSTNSVYYKVYTLLDKMALTLEQTANTSWINKAEQLHIAINTNFWNQDKKNYNYLVDPFGGSDAQESLGISFSLLFGIANAEKTVQIFKNTVVEPAGIPAVYPSFQRYRNEIKDTYGRHSGTVWPHIQGFWADAAMQSNRPDIFSHEFNALTQHAIRDFQFVEIYHPTKKISYGGVQEPSHKDFSEWFVAERQTWSATAYISMIYKNIIGMNFSEQGVTFTPFLPKGINSISLLGLSYKDMILDVNISGVGKRIKHFSVNDKTSDSHFISENIDGKVRVNIQLAE